MKKYRVLFLSCLFLLLSLLASCNRNTNEFTITFDTNGGSIVYDITTDGKSLVELPEDPEKAGYDFKGWYLDDTFKKKFMYDSLLTVPAEKDFTLYAKWQPSIIRVNFYANGGLLINGDKRQQITYGDEIVAPVVEKDGYDFIGWDKDLTNIKENTSVFALYTPKEFTITLDKQNGTDNQTFKATFGAALPQLEVPTKTKYRFGGFYSEKEGEGIKYYDSNMDCLKKWDISKNTTLYAKWYNKITFDKQGGNGGNDDTQGIIGKDMPNADAPTKLGCTFNGYFTETGGQGVQYYDEDMESTKVWDTESDITLYAYWTFNTYEIELDKRGGVEGSDSVTVTFNTEMPQANAPKRSGYMFNGYYTEIDGEGECYYDENMQSQKIWEIDQEIVLYAYWIMEQGTEGLVYQNIYQNGEPTDEYMIVDYKGSYDEIIVPVSYNDKPVTRIADFAFYRSVQITNVTLPNSIKHIGKNAFKDCISMIDIELSENIETIDDFAFYRCISLLNINIPDSVTSLGVSVFAECSNLENISIGAGITYINDYSFENCVSLNELVFLENVIGIGDYAFYNCINLTNVTLSQNLNLLGDFSFAQCIQLKEIAFPNSLISIGKSAFKQCDYLVNIEVPEKVKYIGDFAFNIKYLKSVIINNPTPCVIGEDTFKNDFEKAAYIYLHEESLDEFRSALKWTDYQASFLAKETIENGFVIVESTLKQYIGKDKYIIIPQNVTQIESYAFTFSEGDVDFESNSALTTIHSKAFAFYSGVCITIPESVTSIEDQTFTGCDFLIDLFVYAQTPPDLSDSLPLSIINIYVPSDSVDVYKADSDWIIYADKISTFEGL